MYRHARSPRVCARMMAFIMASVVWWGAFGCSTDKKTVGETSHALTAAPAELGIPPAIRSGTDALSSMVTADRPLTESAFPAARMVIKTATVGCEVADCDTTTTEIARLVGRMRGYIVSSAVHDRDRDHRFGTVVLRVPAPEFEAALVGVKSLALKVESEEVSGNDVTEEFFDLSARLDNKRRAEQRFLQILNAAKTAPEILDIERALMGLREDIERLEAHKRYIEVQTDLSTITVTMYEPRPVVVARVDGYWSKLGNGLRAGVERGLNATVYFANVAVAFLTVGIPLLSAFILIVVLAVRTYRRFRLRSVANNATQV